MNCTRRDPLQNRQCCIILCKYRVNKECKYHRINILICDHRSGGYTRPRVWHWRSRQDPLRKTSRSASEWYDWIYFGNVRITVGWYGNQLNLDRDQKKRGRYNIGAVDKTSLTVNGSVLVHVLCSGSVVRSERNSLANSFAECIVAWLLLLHDCLSACLHSGSDRWRVLSSVLVYCGCCTWCTGSCLL